jgi:glucose/arabinose dehydrogenase
MQPHIRMGKSVHLFVTIALALLASIGTLLGLLIGSAKGAANLPQGFTDSQVVSGLNRPTDMEFAPDGRLFITEQAGTVRIAKPDGTLVTFLNISNKVDSASERGLLGITFDTAFSTNRYVYLHYTRKATSTNPAHNRVVRVTASGDQAVAGSETLIFKLNNLSSATNHNGGSIDFVKDGKLYIATGDNASGANAQSLNNLKGKILRINKSGTIPTDNPFYAKASGKNRAIWALGLRNPFKFAVQPGKGLIYINDVGEKAWEEINQGAPGANYGWPACEGNHDNPAQSGTAKCSAPPYTAPIYEYGHDAGCSITGGAFYNPQTLQYPKEYVGDYFFAEFCGGWIRRLDPATGQVTAFATGLERPVDLEVSHAGGLYYLSRPTTGMVGKITYTGI